MEELVTSFKKCMWCRPLQQLGGYLFMNVCENHVIVLVSKVRASSGHVGVMCHNTDIRVYMTYLFNLHVGRLLLSKYGEQIAYAMDLSLGLRAGATT